MGYRPGGNRNGATGEDAAEVSGLRLRNDYLYVAGIAHVWPASRSIVNRNGAIYAIAYPVLRCGCFGCSGGSAVLKLSRPGDCCAIRCGLQGTPGMEQEPNIDRQCQYSRHGCQTENGQYQGLSTLVFE